MLIGDMIGSMPSDDGQPFVAMVVVMWRCFSPVSCPQREIARSFGVDFAFVFRGRADRQQIQDLAQAALRIGA